MANTLLKPETIVRTFLGILQREIVLPRLVTSVGLDQFRGAKDDTVSLRVPAVLAARDYEWRTRTAPIVVDDLTETKIDVTLDKHPYSAVAITDEELTLDITDFGAQVLSPQVRAVAEKLESYIVAALEGGTYPLANSLTYTIATDDPYDVAVDARAALNANSVPMAGRILAVGANVEAAILKSDTVKKASNAGEGIATSALQDATITRLAGFTVVSVPSLDPDEAFAFHPTAVVFATGAPVVPDGAAFGATQSYQGIAMRWLRDYDPDHLRDRSVVSAFAGASLTADDIAGTPTVVRAVKIATA